MKIIQIAACADETRPNSIYVLTDDGKLFLGKIWLGRFIWKKIPDINDYVFKIEEIPAGDSHGKN